MPAKYIMTTDGPVIFPSWWNHSDMAKAVKTLGYDVTSAGKVSAESPHVSGFSQTLALSPAQGDENEMYVVLKDDLV